MRYIRLAITVLILQNSSPSLSSEASIREITISEKVPLVWVGPRSPVTVTFPGQVSSCKDNSKIIVLTAGESAQTDTGMWFKEIDITLDFSSISSNATARFVEKQEFGVNCTYEEYGQKKKTAMTIRIDGRKASRFVLFKVKDQSYYDFYRNNRIKGYITASFSDHGAEASGGSGSNAQPASKVEKIKKYRLLELKDTVP